MFSHFQPRYNTGYYNPYLQRSRRHVDPYEFYEIERINRIAEQDEYRKQLKMQELKRQKLQRRMMNREKKIKKIEKSVIKIQTSWRNYKKREMYRNAKLINRYLLEEIDESDKYRVPKERRLSYSVPHVLELIQ